MTRYALYKKISSILSPSNQEALFNYIIHFMDDNGDFLRSRHCYSENVLSDSKVRCNSKFVLIAMDGEFDFNSINLNGNNPNLKMQLFYKVSNKEIEDAIALSSELGYEYVIKVNLKTGTIERI